MNNYADDLFVCTFLGNRLLAEFFHCIQQFRLLGRVEVRIRVQRRLDVFMSQPFLDDQRGEALVDEEGRVGMAQIVDTDMLDAGLFAAFVQMPQDGMLCDLKEAVVPAQPVDCLHVVLGNLAEEGRNRDGADTVRRLWLLNQVLLVDTGITFRDAHGLSRPVKVSRRQGQQFTFAHPCPEEEHENSIVQNIVLVYCDELAEFVEGPEVDTVRLLLAHGAAEPRRDLRQVVVLHGEIVLSIRFCHWRIVAGVIDESGRSLKKGSTLSLMMYSLLRYVVGLRRTLASSI